MKIFKRKSYNFGYLVYRIVSPIIDPIIFFNGFIGYFWFIRDLVAYKIKDPKAKIYFKNIYPMVHDKTSLTHLDAHYFYQQLWVFENVLKNKPKSHVDIASTYQMSGYLSKIVPTTFIDYRPIETNLRNLDVKRGDLLDLDIKNDSIDSLSCLHVIEHVGLGRYGDSIDPSGTKKACSELQRVLGINGKLYLSLPIGKEKICFNAHRIFPPEKIIKYFDKLKLVSFSVVDDDGVFHENVSYRDYSKLDYGCGMFEFIK